MVPYFSTNFIFNPYKTKFCGMKKSYAGTEKSYAGTRKVVRRDRKVGTRIFCKFFPEILVDFRKMKSPIYQLFKESGIKSFVLRKFFFQGELETHLN